jgi:methanogenic corrinoid protein MtbC1
MTPPPLPAAPPPLPDVEDFLDRIHGGDGDEALRLVARHMRAGGTVTEVMADLLAPAQRTVGERWHAGAWSVADEHAASAVVEDALGVLAAHLPPNGDGQRLTLVCAEGEWHVTPARMAAMALRDAGWAVDFLGGSMPADHLRMALERSRPHVLVVSATLPLSLPGVAEAVAVGHDAGVPVLVGGAAFGASGHRARMVNADGHAPDLVDATTLLDGWLDHPPTRPMDRTDPELQRQRASLADHHDDLLEAAFTLLAHRIPAMARFTASQREHTRRDLAYTLRFLEAALRVEDVTLFDEYAEWLRTLLEHRGVPTRVLRSSFDALAEVIGTGRPAAVAMLRRDLGSSAA